MKYAKSKLLFIVLFAAAAVVAVGVFGSVYAPVKSVAYAATDFRSVGKAAYMIDASTGSVMYARNEKARLPIASMVKIMTAMLVLEADRDGAISLDDEVTVSKEAASMGGSQVFLEEGDKHIAKDLLRTVIVASANDSCVALAEHVAGSVNAFVAKMNARAKELGMNDTCFKNCTGLPAAESFSCAHDAAVMFVQLMNFPLYFEYAKVWMEDYKHPDGRITEIANTNKLVRFYNGCDGGKTGFTSEAKFCLTATAKRNDMRAVAVVIGADSAKERNAAVSAMFDYAFANFSNKVLLKKGDILENKIQVTGGKTDSLALTVEKDVTQFMCQNDPSQYELRYELPDNIKAPVKNGTQVGKAYLLKDGAIISETPIVAAEDVEKMSLFDAIGEIGKHWNTVV